MVNKFILGTVSRIPCCDLSLTEVAGGLGSADLANKLLKPTAVFFTSTGRIGVVLELGEDISLHMTALQRNLAKRIIGPGNTFHAKYVLLAPGHQVGRS